MYINVSILYMLVFGYFLHICYISIKNNLKRKTKPPIKKNIQPMENRMEMEAESSGTC